MQPGPLNNPEEKHAFVKSCVDKSKEQKQLDTLVQIILELSKVDEDDANEPLDGQNKLQTLHLSLLQSVLFGLIETSRVDELIDSRVFIAKMGVHVDEQVTLSQSQYRYTVIRKS
jgi:hypothetical protein